MGDFKGTPGPWELNEEYRDVTAAGPDGMAICDVLDTAEGLEGSDAQADANARLIAAAPELLGVCLTVLSVARKHTDGSVRFDAGWLDDMRTVVTKATGP